MCNDPREMNGYSIIASAIIDSRSELLLGEAWAGGGMAYVVAIADHPDSEPTEWRTGRYFNERGARSMARARFVASLAAKWDAS